MGEGRVMLSIDHWIALLTGLMFTRKRKKKKEKNNGFPVVLGLCTTVGGLSKMFICR